MDVEPSDLTGQLLIAMPGMEDPRFVQSTIFICAHSNEGTMGIIVNKPAPGVRFGDLLEQMDIPASHLPDIRVNFGGPVETSRGFVLHSAEYTSDQGTMTVSDSISMTATMDVLQDIANGEGPKRSLMALGYSGWGPGQLEGEIIQNGWLTVAPTDDIVFGRAHEHKWTQALRLLGVDPLTLSDTAGHA